MALTKQQIDFLLRNKYWADQIILNQARKSGDVVYGAQAINAQVPKHLQKPTSDYDIYTKKPYQTAKKIVIELNTAFGGKYFYLRKAKHKGTWKVKSKIARETVADYTKYPNGVPHKNLMGVNYATIGHSKKIVKGLVSNPDAGFRRKKDMSTLARLRAFESRWAGTW